MYIPYVKWFARLFKSIGCRSTLFWGFFKKKKKYLNNLKVYYTCSISVKECNYQLKHLNNIINMFMNIGEIKSLWGGEWNRVCKKRGFVTDIPVMIMCISCQSIVIEHMKKTFLCKKVVNTCINFHLKQMNSDLITRLRLVF